MSLIPFAPFAARSRDCDGTNGGIPARRIDLAPRRQHAPHRTEDSDTMKMIRMLFSLAALLFLEAAPLTAQIPASELPPPGTDSGLDGKYDPENGIAQLIRDKSAESAASKLIEGEHGPVLLPQQHEEVDARG